ncbi:MAG: cupin domain-containing protein [Pirellulales bacterium]|nr:cupin domain-containing protein [Pirellulales bacterium]
MFQYLVDKTDCVRMDPFPGVTMHATEAEKTTLSLVEMEPGAIIAEHSHPHEQIGYMVAGGGEFIIAGQSYQVKVGQMWRLPGGVPHKVIAGPDGLTAVDVFYPVREDMRGEWKAEQE